MNRHLVSGLHLVLALWGVGGQAQSADVPTPTCKTPEVAKVQLRPPGPRDGDRLDALLSGSARFALELRDAHSGALLWTAGATPGAVLEVPEMHSPFVARPRPVDLDGDGLDDRIYIADLGGRVWRLDIREASSSDRWIEATLLADLSGEGLRGFLAAPDVALHLDTAHVPWLSIAIGSISHAGHPASNRFYVLRDEVADRAERPDATPRIPLHEADLQLVEPGSGAGGIDRLIRDPILAGYYIPLGPAQVLAPSLTINGVIFFTAAVTPQQQAGGCASLATPATRLEVRAVSAVDGSRALDLNGDGTLSEDDAVLELVGTHRADAAVRIPDDAGQTAPGIHPCLIDAEPVPGCQLDTRLRRRYWLREDAD
jgi:type IV pilus assembly protein PilY1